MGQFAMFGRLGEKVILTFQQLKANGIRERDGPNLIFRHDDIMSAIIIAPPYLSLVRSQQIFSLAIHKLYTQTIIHNHRLHDFILRIVFMVWVTEVSSIHWIHL